MVALGWAGDWVVATGDIAWQASPVPREVAAAASVMEVSVSPSGSSKMLPSLRVNSSGADSWMLMMLRLRARLITESPSLESQNLNMASSLKVKGTIRGVRLSR